MNQENGRPPAVDMTLERFSRIATPPEVELRLQDRIQEFYRQPETAPPQATSLPRRSRFKRLLPACVAAGLTVALVLVATVSLVGNRDAWAQVAKSLQSKAWMHLTMQVPAGEPLPEGLRPPEAWFSAKHKASARRFMKAAQYIDFARQETFDYDPTNDVITHSMTRDNDNVDFGHFGALLQLASEGARDLKLPESPIQIVERTQHDVRDKVRPWIEYVFKCRDPRRTPPDYSMTFRVDPQTQLIVEMRSTEKLFSNDPADVRIYTVDYPESGPDDIHALGAPRTADVVDRRRAKSKDAREITEFLAAYAKSSLKPIEPYSTIILASLSEPTDSCVIQAFQGRNDGKSLHVDQADQQQLQELRNKVYSKQIAFPDVADRVLWWKQEVAKLTFAPMPRGEENMPHTVGHPYLLGSPSAPNVIDKELEDPDCQLTLDRHPASGPAGTVLLNYIVDSKTGYSDCRWWIDPERDYLVLRSEMHFSRDHAAWNNVTQVIDKLEKSPGGAWYATEVRMGRIEKSGDDLSDGIVTPTVPMTTGMEIGPVSTTLFRYFVEFK